MLYATLITTISCKPPGAKLKKADIKSKPKNIFSKYAKKAAIPNKIADIIAP